MAKRVPWTTSVQQATCKSHSRFSIEHFGLMTRCFLAAPQAPAVAITTMDHLIHSLPPPPPFRRPLIANARTTDTATVAKLVSRTDASVQLNVGKSTKLGAVSKRSTKVGDLAKKSTQLHQPRRHLQKHANNKEECLRMMNTNGD